MGITECNKKKKRGDSQELMGSGKTLHILSPFVISKFITSHRESASSAKQGSEEHIQVWKINCMFDIPLCHGNMRLSNKNPPKIGELAMH